MKVVILAGGFGSRLAEETSIKPKPMVEIGDIPIIGRLFRSDAKVDNQEQVLIFIAPKTV